MSQAINPDELGEFFHAELIKAGFDFENPNPKIAFKIFCEAFAWELTVPFDPLSFLVETHLTHKSYPTKEKTAYVGFTAQYMVMPPEVDYSELYRVGIEFEFPLDAFPELGENQWFESNLKSLEEAIAPKIAAFEKMLNAKPLNASEHFDIG